VRVRVHGEKAQFLVSSLTSAGTVYSVDPADWRCSCPDFNRRDQACKHVQAAYVLKRVAQGARTKHGCRVCVDGWVYIGEDVINSETGEVTTFHNPVRCRHCAGVQPPYLSDEELQEWMASVRWIFAKGMPKHPHEYCLKREQDEELFERVVRTIWDHGYDRPYLRRPWRSLDVGDFYVWVHTEPKPRMPVPPGEYGPSQSGAEGSGEDPMKFELGQVVATPGALKDFGPKLIAELLDRHARGDWGDLCAFDRQPS
jgi:hypothetical protein